MNTPELAVMLAAVILPVTPYDFSVQTDVIFGYAILITVPFVEGINKFQNPFRRPIAMLVFLFSIAFAIWFGIGACLPISQAVTLGLF